MVVGFMIKTVLPSSIDSLKLSSDDFLTPSHQPRDYICFTNEWMIPFLGTEYEVHKFTGVGVNP